MIIPLGDDENERYGGIYIITGITYIIGRYNYSVYDSHYHLYRSHRLWNHLQWSIPHP
jgi:hypothetical protein